ncbi:MAG: tRNA (adenosine(37)-N6)-threonylcarbamoyltransferase complex transferase subunit TsaD [bacterium]
MLILGIESSCDDTSIALMDCSKLGCFVVSQKSANQINIHKKYGGVVPELAGRAHCEKIIPMLSEVLNSAVHALYPSQSADYLIKKIKAIAVTAGPGLITGLLVGSQTARTLSFAWKVPLIPINHIEGHFFSVKIKDRQQKNSKKNIAEKNIKQKTNHIEFPALALIASGGHTELILSERRGLYKRLGSTKDDAAGECFDKVAKLIGLEYPGGPEISRLAKKGNPKAINFPRPMLNQNNFDFSFAGLKTSALYWLRDHKNKLNKNDFCASFQQAIIDVLVGKTIKSALKYKPKTIILAGGVSANQQLRKQLKHNLELNCPAISFMSPKTAYSMDNAGMIAVAGYYHAKRNDFVDWQKIHVDPNWKLA